MKSSWQPKLPRNPFNLAVELLYLRLRRFRFLPQGSRRIYSAAGGSLDGWQPLNGGPDNDPKWVTL